MSSAEASLTPIGQDAPTALMSPRWPPDDQASSRRSRAMHAYAAGTSHEASRRMSPLVLSSHAYMGVYAAAPSSPYMYRAYRPRRGDRAAYGRRAPSRSRRLRGRSTRASRLMSLVHVARTGILYSHSRSMCGSWRCCRAYLCLLCPRSCPYHDRNPIATAEVRSTVST